MLQQEEGLDGNGRGGEVPDHPFLGEWPEERVYSGDTASRGDVDDGVRSGGWVLGDSGGAGRLPHCYLLSWWLGGEISNNPAGWNREYHVSKHPGGWHRTDWEGFAAVQHLQREQNLSCVPAWKSPVVRSEHLWVQFRESREDGLHFLHYSQPYQPLPEFFRH